jgi:hypothetical protein
MTDDASWPLLAEGRDQHVRLEGAAASNIGEMPSNPGKHPTPTPGTDHDFLMG